MTFEINFNNFDHNFCESTIYSNNQHPEYLNSISSLFITFVGLNGLRKTNDSIFHKLLFSSLAVNGITSCFYHYYNSIGWGLLDRMSMVLIALFSNIMFISNINKIIQLNNNILNFIYILTITYFTILLTLTGLHVESLFNILFGLFLTSLMIFMYVINKYKNNLDIPNKIINFGWSGIIYIGLSGFFWLTTEKLCTKIWYIKYLYGHVWWHIFVSYGGYLLSVVSNYFSVDKKINNITIKYDVFNFPYLIVGAGELTI